MSAGGHFPGEPHRPRVRLEEDVVPGRPVLIATAVLLVVFGAGILWAGLVARGTDAPLAEPPRAAPREIGLPEQTLFDTDRTSERLRETARRRLQSWQWVDRERGIVRVPVEDAMELYVREQSQ